MKKKGWNKMGKLDDLERLQKLKENGILSEEEFKKEKQKILDEEYNEKSDEETIKNNKEKQNKEHEQTTNVKTNETKINNNAKTNKINTQPNKSEKNKKNKSGVKTFFIILIILVGLGIGVAISQEKIEESKEVQVPNLEGKTISEAKEELANLELNISANSYSYYSDSPEAIIQSQEKGQGEKVKRGSTIKVNAKTQEQINKEKQEEEERKQKEAEAKEKGYRSSPATEATIINCAKTLIDNSLRSSSTAKWGECEKVDEDNYGRCLVYVSLEAQNGFGAYSKLNYFVVLQYVKTNGEFTYKPYSYSYKLETFGAQSVYDYYVTSYKNGEKYNVIQTFLNNNEWNTRPSDA
mgnify:FL=1